MVCLLGASNCGGGRRETARPLFLESLEFARQVGNAAIVGRNQLWLAEAAFDDGDDDAARAWAEQALDSADAAGSRLNASMGFRLLGDVEARQGNFDRAHELLEASLAHAREIGRWFASWPASHLADLLVEQHDFVELVYCSQRPSPRTTTPGTARGWPAALKGVPGGL